MSDAIERVKRQAKRLLQRVRAGEAEALAHVRELPEFRDSQLGSDEVQHKHCLATVGRQLGFSSWQHAQRVFRGDADETDFGTLLYPRGGSAFTNEWFADYDEAQRARRTSGGFLLGYRRQFVVVTDTFVRTMGLDPDDPDWSALGRDWVRPSDPDARARLYATLVSQRLAA